MVSVIGFKISIVCYFIRGLSIYHYNMKCYRTDSLQESDLEREKS